VQITSVVDPPQLPQFFIGMGKKPGSLASDGVGQQDFGGQARC
jgi:hypothetical protein